MLQLRSHRLRWLVVVAEVEEAAVQVALEVPAAAAVEEPVVVGAAPAVAAEVEVRAGVAVRLR
jgi:hypothetical protein